MQDFPHHYTVTAQGGTVGDVELTTGQLSALRSAAPLEFDGPGNRWSPETLLVAAIGDCLVLTFRGIARASNVSWSSLQCDVTGTLDRVAGVTQFTAFEVRAHLQIPADTSMERARRALNKAERTCLIANSLKGAVHFAATIDVVPEVVARPA